MNEQNQKVKGALISAGVKFRISYTYPNGDWEVKLEGEKYFKLYREDINLLDKINATSCFTFLNGDYKYKINNFWHLIREGKDLLKDVKAIRCRSSVDGSWSYQDELGRHKMAEDERIIKN